jgi:hypothetical protein
MSPTHVISESGSQKMMVRYTISPNFQIGLNVEILSISTLSIWSRSQHPILVPTAIRFSIVIPIPLIVRGGMPLSEIATLYYHFPECFYVHG